MRLRFPDGRATVLTYCTNVHAIEELSAAREALGRFCAPLRRRLGTPVLSLGLWLSGRAASALRQSERERERFKAALVEHGLEVVTLNGFPYGDFHAERVKEEVYRPDWVDPRRAEYILDLATVLADWLPHDVGEGTISTLPLAYTARSSAGTIEASADALVRLAAALERLADRCARSVRVCLEPEPDCLIETTRQAIEFFTGPIREAARRVGASEAALRRHLGVCFDACHQAVQFEETANAWKSLEAAAVPVGKVQLSCALEVPADAARDAVDILTPFDEPRFLHQVRRRIGGRVDARPDLGEALYGSDALDPAGEWRVHFHAPLDWTPRERGLRTTRDDLVRLIPEIARGRSIPHLEVETYTWGVLPDSVRPRDDATLVEGIAREIEFAERELARFGARRA